NSKLLPQNTMPLKEIRLACISAVSTKRFARFWTLDIRPEVVEEAKAIGADFIFAHHPPIFKPVKRLTEDDPQQSMYAEIIRSGIGVYAAHTNLDAAPAGMNDWLSDLYEVE